MKRQLTHYDVLQVGRGAEPAVLSAAYRALSKLYHPDHHPGDEKAARMMAQVNASYKILIDPISRARYDEWLAKWEADQKATPEPQAQAEPRNEWAKSSVRPSTSPTKKHLTVVKGAVTFVLVIVGMAAIGSTVDSGPSSVPYSASPPEVVDNAESPQAAPDPRLAKLAEIRRCAGDAVPPVTSSELMTPKRVGNAQMVVDNGTSEDAVVVLLDVADKKAVRQFYVRARTKAVAHAVPPGEYIVRFAFGTAYSTSRHRFCETFDAAESDSTISMISNAKRYSVETITLHKVRDGRFSTHSIQAAAIFADSVD